MDLCNYMSYTCSCYLVESMKWSKMQTMSIAMLGILAKKSLQLVELPVEGINSTIPTEITNEITHFMQEFLPCLTNTDLSMDYVQQCLDPDSKFHQTLLQCLYGIQKLCK